MSVTIHRGDLGTIIRGALVDQDGAVIDSTSATTREFRFEKPDGTTVDQPAVQGAASNVIELVAPPSLFDQSGDWRVQGHVVLDASNGFWTEIKPFEVSATLQAP